MSTKTYPRDATEAASDMKEDELDFIEREVFFAFDEACRQYQQEDIDTKAAIVMYERALETIRAVRTVRNELDEEQFEQAKQIHDSLTE